MYLPTEDLEARQQVTDAFLAYRDLCKSKLWNRCCRQPGHHPASGHRAILDGVGGLGGGGGKGVYP